MLRQRVMTAVLLAVILISCLLAGKDWVAGFLAIVSAVAVYELLMLTLRPSPVAGVFLALIFVLLCWQLSTAMTAAMVHAQSLVGALLWVAIFCCLPLYRYSGKWSLTTRSLYFIFGLCSLWICVHALISLYQHFEQDLWVLSYLLTLVWVADIGAYFFGRRFGRHKLAPGISPGKTWEGVAGGLGVNLIWVLLIYALTTGWGMSLIWFMVVSLLTSIASVVGDLFESMLKREAGVKDSGRLLPGHGGVLDRTDSVIAAAPVFLSGIFLGGLV